MSQIRFITTTFGNRHVNMLLPLLFSIQKHCPDANASIYWEDILDETKQIIKSAFPNFDYIDTSFDFSTDITKRISSKTIIWEYAAKQQIPTEEWLLFIDADTLVTRDPLPLLNSINTDIIITHRNESPFLINTGVMACKGKQSASDFFSEWQKETTHILETPELFSQANDKKLPYGGADQMSLQKLIHYSKEQDTFSFNDLTVRAIHCKFLNETYSTSVTKDTHIIHYKGGWRDIIFFGSPFTKNRPLKLSWEMYTLYIETFRESIQHMNSKLGTSFYLHDWGVDIPFYINTKTLTIKSPLHYEAYGAYYLAKTFFPRLKKYLKEKISN